MKRKRPLNELVGMFTHHQQELLKNADRHKEEVVSQSLETIREVLGDPQGHPYKSYVSDALMLLAHAEEPMAHAYLQQILRLPEASVEELIGESLPIMLPAYLYKTCGSSVKEIERLVSSPKVYVYCRVAGMQAIVFAAQDGIVPKKDALNFLSSLFTGKEADSPDSSFWDEAAQAICRIGPDGYFDVIRSAIKRGLTDISYIDERYLAQVQP